MDPVSPLVEPLTRREVEILSLLGQNLSNREIAGRLVMSLNSIKWYNQQIFGKLGVANRQEAVAKARELGLLARQAAFTQPAHNLPGQISSFIGRKREIDQVVGLVSAHPLVTLTGAGGVGKTRLALAAAGALVDLFSDGAWYVELAVLANPFLVPQALASALGIRPGPGQPILEAIQAYLSDRQVLLVLDNCEHLVSACAELAQALLSRQPRLKILATSRESLGVSGEVIYSVPSLGFPDAFEAQAVEDYLAFEAVRLFVERARAIPPGFHLTVENLPVIVRICRRLDGIPLAIELAAARTRLLSVEQIAERLGDAFHLLTGGSRTALPHHQTLRACIDWSYNLLAQEEQILLRRLAVFAGGWTLEAAEQVCSDPRQNDQVEQPDLRKDQILELLGRLVDKSLVQFEPGDASEARYTMLETVRQYANERLAEAGESDLLRGRHLACFHALARLAAPHLRTSQAKSWADRLECELDNIRRALDGSLSDPNCSSSGSLEQGLELAAALHHFWHLRGHHFEGAHWLERLLQAQEGQSSARVARGRALNVLSHMVTTARASTLLLRPQASTAAEDQESEAIFLGLGEAYLPDLARARFNAACRTRSPEALLALREQFLALGDRLWAAECDLVLMWLVYPFGHEKAIQSGEEALGIFRAAGDRYGEGQALHRLAYCEFWRGDPGRAIALANEGIACLRTAGEPGQAEGLRGVLAAIAASQGDYPEAFRQAALIRAAARQVGSRELSNHACGFEGLTAWAGGEYERAELLCEEILANTPTPSIVENYFPNFILARVAISRGETARARHYLRLVLETARDYSYFLSSLAFRAIAGSAGLAILESQARWAAIVAGALDRHGERARFHVATLTEQHEFAEALAAARAALPEEDFQAAWASGQALTVRQLIDDTLAWLADIPKSD